MNSTEAFVDCWQNNPKFKKVDYQNKTSNDIIAGNGTIFGVNGLVSSSMLIIKDKITFLILCDVIALPCFVIQY